METRAAAIARGRILSVEHRELPVQRRIQHEKIERHVEEHLRADGEELSRILARVRIEPGFLAAIDLLDELVVRGLERRRPLGDAHAAMQRRHPVHGAVELIELVRELVHDDVVAFALPARLDVLPAENDRTRFPGLAAQHVVADVNDARLVDALAVTHDELAGVENHGYETLVAIEAELEDRQTRERRDARSHRVIDREAARGLDALLVQEQQRELSEARALVVVERTQNRHGGEHLVPRVVRNAPRREDLAPPFALQESEHYARRLPLLPESR